MYEVRSTIRGLALSFLLNAAQLNAQTLVLDDPLSGSTLGTRAGGSFVGGGWQVTGQHDAIYWHIPTLTRGAVEWDMRGLIPNDGRAGMEDKAELFHMYDYTFGNADEVYVEGDGEGYRNNPYKHFVRKIGPGVAAFPPNPSPDALELVWQISPNYEEPDTSVLSWNPNATYRFREEWGPDGAGNSFIKTYRDSVLLRTTTV